MPATLDRPMAIPAEWTLEGWEALVAALTRRKLLGGGLALGLLTACGAAIPATPTAPAPRVVVRHALGETVVAPHPQRVVAVGYTALEMALALGIEPVAVNQTAGIAPFLRERITGTPVDIGTNAQPDIEKVLTTRPDLILTAAGAPEIYASLAKTGPTVAAAANTGDGAQWRDTFRVFAEALDKRAEAEKLIADHDARVAKVRATVAQRPGGKEVSIVRIAPAFIQVLLAGTCGGSVVAEVGLTRPATQQQGASPLVMVAQENLRDLDADTMFVFSWDANSVDGAQKSRDSYAALKNQPLWNQLRAVQAARLFDVGPHWIHSGPLTAQLVLDDIAKYLG